MLDPAARDEDIISWWYNFRCIMVGVYQVAAVDKFGVLLDRIPS